MKYLVTLLAISLIGIAAAATQLRAPANDTINLTPENTVVFRSEVNDESVQNVELQLADLALKRGSKDYPIYLVMDCPGGSIDSGLSFIELAKTVPNVKTVTLFAASMCSGIVEALPGERLVTESGILMFHRAKGQVSGQFEEGELESRLNLYKSIVRNMEQVNANRMSISLESYKAKVKDELWIYGKDNVEQKSADKVVNLSCSKELMDSKVQTVESTIFGTIKLTFSGCPLLKAPIETEQGEE